MGSEDAQRPTIGKANRRDMADLVSDDQRYMYVYSLHPPLFFHSSRSPRPFFTQGKSNNSYRSIFTTQQFMLAGRRYDISSTKDHDPPPESMVIVKATKKKSPTIQNGDTNDQPTDSGTTSKTETQE